jgi:hypothetical protein
MATDEIIDKLLNPKPEDANETLERLGLARFPTREEILQKIEKEYLEPKLPEDENWQV